MNQNIQNQNHFITKVSRGDYTVIITRQRKLWCLLKMRPIDHEKQKRK